MAFQVECMPIDTFDLEILSRPFVNYYTKKGALNLLPRLLGDLFDQCDGNEEEFLNLLVACLPFPTVVAITHAEYLGTDESGKPLSKMKRYIYDENLDPLELPYKAFRETKIEDVLVHIKSDDMFVGETQSIIKTGYKITFPSNQDPPTDRELLEMLKVFRDVPETRQGEIVVKKIKEISIEGEEKKVVEEELKYLVEEVGEDKK
ncbi:MAG: hypothetical protein JSW28_10105 [Thermoplasmata archaeon]|nr:MAG: hypothetical protein JSW28_10105 [Thermoplasmata archaeon]